MPDYLRRFAARTYRVIMAGLVTAGLVLPCAPAVQASQNLPSLGDTERGVLSPLMERRLGERIMRDVRSDPAYVDDGIVSEYLEHLGNSLVELSPEVRGEAGYDFAFFAVKDDTLNAFALPGGFIGVHTGLILAAQSESELASVFAHEIGHVAQRHIARIIGEQQNNSMIQLASLLLSAIVATSSADAAMATAMGGTGIAAQRYLNFSRQAEREADRIGLDILQKGGYDTSGMVSFFGRMQNASKVYSSQLPAVLMTHPLTTERIADIEVRIRGARYRQHVDNPDFEMVKARVRVLQYPNSQGLRDADAYFEAQLRQDMPAKTRAAYYGMALIDEQQRQYDEAWNNLQRAKAVTPSQASVALASLEASLLAERGQPQQALVLLDKARGQFPVSRQIAQQYAQALVDANQLAAAQDYLREQVRMYRQDSKVQYLLANVYEKQGKVALQHMALAEAYALSGSLPAALEQLGIARRAKDATFYDQSVIDAREKEMRARWDRDKEDKLG